MNSVVYLRIGKKCFGSILEGVICC